MTWRPAAVVAGVCAFALSLLGSPWWAAIALVMAAIAWGSVAVARWASRRGRLVRVAIVVAPLVFYGLCLVARHYAPTCEDFLDGPCAWNRVSDLAVALFCAAVLAAAPAVAVLVAWLADPLGRQDGRVSRWS